jgi:hypothetical protein
MESHSLTLAKLYFEYPLDPSEKEVLPYYPNEELCKLHLKTVQPELVQTLDYSIYDPNIHTLEAYKCIDSPFNFLSSLIQWRTRIFHDVDSLCPSTGYTLEPITGEKYKGYTLVYLHDRPAYTLETNCFYFDAFQREYLFDRRQSPVEQFVNVLYKEWQVCRAKRCVLFSSQPLVKSPKHLPMLRKMIEDRQGPKRLA